MSRIIVGALGAWVLAAAVWTVPARAQAAGERSQGIIVTGRAEVNAKPDTIELTGVVRGEAELANDAMVKYRDNKRRATEAIEKLKIEGLSIKGTGFNITSGAASQQMRMMMQGMPAEGTPAGKVVIGEGLTISMPVAAMDEPEIMKTIIRIVDAGKDAGASIGGVDPAQMMEMYQRGNYQSQPMAVFKLVSSDDVRAKAYEAAMRDARASADRLATLSEVKLGRVLSISDASPARSNNRSSRVIYSPFGMVMPAGDEKPTYDSQTFAPIPVTVILTVQYAIQ